MQSERGNRILGAILAGGASRRFGSNKALAKVGGVSIIARVAHAVARMSDVIVVANEQALAIEVGWPHRIDHVPGLGPLAGVETALKEAVNRRLDGALCVSCDMPFLPMPLLREIALRGDPVRAVVPESGRGPEPLCAWYPVGALKEVRRLLATDDRSMRALLASIDTVRMPVGEVRRFGDPEILFFNVNTPADLERAEQIARQIDASS